jgi:hypothetical protein
VGKEVGPGDHADKMRARQEAFRCLPRLCDAFAGQV